MTFERGFERDPMGSYLDSLERVRALEPELVLPGHGPAFRDGARRAEAIARGKMRRLNQVRELVESAERTTPELTEKLFGAGLRARNTTSRWPRSSPTSPTTRRGASCSAAAGRTACSCGTRAG